MSGRHTMPPSGRRKGPEPDATETPEPQLSEPEATETEAVEPEEHDETEPDAVEPETAEPEETESEDTEPEAAEPAERPARSRAGVVVAILSILALLLAVASGVLRWLIVTDHEKDVARTESVQAARDITVRMLSYEPDTVEQQLTAVKDRLTGDFLGTYTALTNEVIPAAQAQNIAATAEVPQAGSVSATPDSAEAVLFVNQTVTVGNQAPQRTLSVVRVTMVKQGDSWLMSEYEPVSP